MAYVLEEKARAKYVGVPTLSIAKRIRQELSKCLRQVWSTPEAFELRDLMATELYEYGQELREVARSLGLDEAYRKVAEKHGIGYKLKVIWGKIKG